MKTTRLTNRLRRALRGGSRGVTLIEALVAMALVGIIAAAFLGALALAAQSAAIADIRTTAESLARSELEYAKSQHYRAAPWEYEVTSDGSTCTPEDDPDWWCNTARRLPQEYDGYTVLVETAPLDEDDIQILNVTVRHHSREEAVTVLSGYRLDR